MINGLNLNYSTIILLHIDTAQRRKECVATLRETLYLPHVAASIPAAALAGVVADPQVVRLADAERHEELEDLGADRAGVGEGGAVAVVVLEVLAERAERPDDEGGRLPAQPHPEHPDQPGDGGAHVAQLGLLECSSIEILNLVQVLTQYQY